MKVVKFLCALAITFVGWLAIAATVGSAIFIACNMLLKMHEPTAFLAPWGSIVAAMWIAYMSATTYFTYITEVFEEIGWASSEEE